MLLLKFKYPNLISTDDCSSDNLSIYQMVVIVLLLESLTLSPTLLKSFQEVYNAKIALSELV